MRWGSKAAACTGNFSSHPAHPHPGIVRSHITRSGTEPAGRGEVWPQPQAICKEHYYEFLNGGRRDESGRLLAKCRDCPVGRVFVLGINRLIDGKIMTI